MTIFEIVASTVIAKGFSSSLEYIKNSRIDIRAVNKTAFNFKGVVPGGKEALNEYLKNWTDSSDFEKLIKDLSEGESIQNAVNSRLDSFLKATPIQRRDKAQKVLDFLMQVIRDELYNSREGNAQQMHRIEQMHAEDKSQFEQIGVSLQELKNHLPNIPSDVRDVINKYLTSTDEWDSLKNLLANGKLNEAQNNLEERLNKLEQFLEEQPDIKTILRDHRIDLLLKLSAVLSQMGDFSGSKKYFYQAKELGFAKQDQVKRALSILLNLTKVEEYEIIFDEHKEKLQDKLSVEIDLAVLKREWNRVLELIPEGDGNKFRLLHLKIIAELESAKDEKVSKKAPEIFSLLLEASELLDNHPLHKVQLSTTAVNFIYRIVDNMIETPGLDRRTLIEFTKNHIENAIQACEQVNFERGISIVLNFAYKLYYLLRESDRLKELEHKILDLETKIETKKEREGAIQDGRISQAQQLYLDAVDLLDHPTGAHEEKAKRFLQTAIDLSDHENVKTKIAKTLIELFVNENDPKSARRVLQQFSDVSEYNKTTLEIPVINSEHGRSRTIKYIQDAIKHFPNSIHLYRNLIECLIQETESKKDTGVAPKELSSNIKKICTYVANLDKILPTDANSILLVRAYIANHDYSGAINLLRKFDRTSNVYLEANQILSECLIKLERVEEAAEHLVQLAEITHDPNYANHAANYLLEAQKFEDAINFLESWVKKHPDNSFLLANLALAIIALYPDDIGQGRKSFNLLIKACKKRSDLKNVNFWLAKAASIAGKPEIGQRYMQREFKKLPTLPVREKKDFNSLSEVSDRGMTLVNLDSETGIQAFVQWNQEFKESLNRLHQLNLISYGDIFSRNGRPWEQWLSWTQLAKEDFKEYSKSEVIKAPLPYKKREANDCKRLLLDLTALLTLCALDSTEKIVKALHKEGWKLYIKSSDLHRLRIAVSSPEDLLFDTVELPYEELLNELRNHDLLVSYSSEDVEKFSELVHESLQEELGNSQYDFGLAQSLEKGVYVSDDHDTLSFQQEAKSQGIISSKALLKTFIEDGVIGKNEARKAEDTDERFKNWRESEKVKMPKHVVISAFSLPYWFKTGLLISDNKSWLRGEPEWPKLHIGPFCQSHLIDQTQKNRSKKLKSKFASRQYTVLGQLISDNIIEVLPDKNRLNSQGERIRLYEVVPNAIDLIHLASHYNLHIWADDRALAYLLWPYGHPLQIPELANEVRQIKQLYPGIDLFTTEELLEELHQSDLVDHDELSKLGYNLVETGYRPLSFKLALTHLFKNFAYKSGSLRYKPFLEAIEGIVSSSESHTNKDNSSFSLDPKPQQRFFLGTVLPDLFTHIWFANVSRSIKERKKLADDLLELMIKYIDEHRQDMPDKMANFWVGILHSNTNYFQKNLSRLNDSDKTEKDEFFNRFQESLNWFASSLKEYEKEGQLRRVVLEIEDRIIDLMSSISEEIVQESFLDLMKQGKEMSIDEFHTKSTVAAIRYLHPFLSPFLHTNLLNEFNPLLRRTIGALGQYESELKVSEVYSLNEDKGNISIIVEEEEVELFALKVIKHAFHGDPNYQRAIRNDLTLYCIWHRPVPEENESLIKQGYEKHDVTIDISLIRLLLRDEIHQIPALIDVILRQLHLFDPLFGQILVTLKSDLIHEDSEVRSQARQELAVAIVNSIYFEFHRNLTHSIERLQNLEIESLETFLSPEIEWLEPELKNPHIRKLAEREFPHSMLNSIFFLSNNSETLYQTGLKMVDSLITETSEDKSLPDPLILMIQVLEMNRSPLVMAWNLLQFLILISRAKEEETIIYQGVQWKPKVWVKYFLSQVLDENDQNISENKGIERRSVNLKKAHACILRLATYAICSPTHMDKWKKELKDDDKVIQNCLHGIMSLSERLFFFLSAKYESELEVMASVTQEAVQSLNITFEEPGYFPDRFNPFLFGPHLLDHEIAAIFHSLISFIKHDEKPESALDLEWLKEIVEPWSFKNHVGAQEIYEQQKEKNLNVLNLQMILSPHESANKLLKVIDQKI